MAALEKKKPADPSTVYLQNRRVLKYILELKKNQELFKFWG